ncbi:MAG: hypothetical protein K2P92_07030, partial [Bdellovibrionaceae bacterium]|nr:hypothetical protein [Pseudobdellovibrionaceae bacterium]
MMQTKKSASNSIWPFKMSPQFLQQQIITLFKKISYPALAMLLMSTCCVLFTFTEYHRVFPHLQLLFLQLKIFLCFVGIFLTALTFYTKPNDFLTACMMLYCVAYCVSLMWFAPLYEIAYLQCAIGCAFFSTRRIWIFPTIFGLGLVGIEVSYFLQDRSRWMLPPVDRVDWIWSMTIIFLLSIIIRQFALQSRTKEAMYNLRFSQIGRETTRILHDVKGMLSVPRLRIENILFKGGPIDEALLKDLQALESEISAVAINLKHLNRLVETKVENERISPQIVFTEAYNLLHYRFKEISVQNDIPSTITINTNSNLMRSVFFNLLVNTLDAFDRRPYKKSWIQLSFKNNMIIYEDNAGGMLKTELA